LPSPNQFGHLICAIPKQASKDDGYLWLDPTVETSSYNTLPYQDQGRHAFVITDSDIFFATTPIDQAEDNKFTMSIEMKIDQDGTMTGVERVMTSGQFSIDYKLLYKNIKPSDLVDFFQIVLNQEYPGVKIHDVSLSGIDDLDAPLETSVWFSVEHYGLSSGDEGDETAPPTLLISIPDGDFSDQTAMVAQQKRKYELKIRFPMQIQKKVTVSVPDGYVLHLIPGARP
jgi:hypothetical protein